MLAGCASVPLPPADEMPATPAVIPLGPGDTAPLPPPLLQGKSRWQPVRWAELPGFREDALHEAERALALEPDFTPAAELLQRLRGAPSQT